MYNSESINLENDVIVKVWKGYKDQVQDENYEYTDYSIDNKKRLECDAKSERNSLILQAESNNNQDNIKEENVNIINIAKMV